MSKLSQGILVDCLYLQVGLAYQAMMFANTLQLQTYWPMNDVCKLALKIERQLKEAKVNRYGFWDSYSSKVSSKPTLPSKVVKVDEKKEALSGSKQAIGSSTTYDHRCFKCHDLSHIASDYPN